MTQKMNKDKYHCPFCHAPLPSFTFECACGARGHSGRMYHDQYWVYGQGMDARDPAVDYPTDYLIEQLLWDFEQIRRKRDGWTFDIAFTVSGHWRKQIDAETVRREPREHGYLFSQDTHQFIPADPSQEPIITKFTSADKLKSGLEVFLS